ncbi:MAG: protein kinase [Gammaproteobacteria bacterium]|nr:protein kinase [Gammaproteobacteria bacterium]
MKALPCPPALWPRFSALLDTALELDATAREAWLSGLAADDAELKPWLAAVLRSEGPLTPGRLDRLPAGARAAEAPPEFSAGDRVGPWRLLRLLGAGGMGQVWLARRDDGAYQREVALKLPHAHLIAGALQRRFARERNFLAGLVHPNIARFYDAGLGEHGQPWLALEYVDGVALGDYCRQHALDTRARIGLMLQVAAAVQAAHARLIVHRDLKPANVLVAAGGQVKLLDFGIAKLLDDDDALPGTALTQVGGRAATPDYAAPEQLDGGAITVATDVHALGVMLYELLTGSRPFAAQSPLGRLVAERGDAPLASSRVPRPQRAALSGDLDAILAKALEAQPEQRYATVEALASDLSRHLADLPIAARRIGRRARLAKFLRRNRRAVTLAGGFLLLLAAGVAATAWQAVQTATQARRAAITKDFLISVFKASDPRSDNPRPLGQRSVRELLDLSIDRVETELAGEPDLQIELLGVMGYALGLSVDPDDEARFEQVMNRRLEIAQQHFGGRHAVVVETRLVEGWGEVYYQNYAAALAKVDEADRLLHESGLDRSALRAEWWMLRGRALRGLPGTDGERLNAYQQAARLYAEVAPDHPDRANAEANIASEYLFDADWAKAAAQARRAIALARGLPERDDLSLAVTLLGLGRAERQQGDLAAAAAAYDESAALALHTLGKQPTWWLAESRHAQMLHQQGDRAAAEARFAAVEAAIPADWSKTTADTEAREMRAAAWLAEGRAAEALPLLEAAEQVYRTRAPSQSDLPRVQLLLGRAYAALGRDGLARQQLQAAFDHARSHMRAGHPDRLAAVEAWTRFLIDRGEPDRAAPLIDAALAEPSPPGEARALLLGARARVALQRHAPQAAERDSAAALAMIEQVQRAADLRSVARLQRLRAEVLAAAGDVAAAQALEDRAAAASARLDAPDSDSRRRRLFERS